MQQATDSHASKRRTVPLPTACMDVDGITRERDEEAMHLVAGALGMPARPGVG